MLRPFTQQCISRGISQERKCYFQFSMEYTKLATYKISESLELQEIHPSGKKPSEKRFPEKSPWKKTPEKVLLGKMLREIASPPPTLQKKTFPRTLCRPGK